MAEGWIWLGACPKAGSDVSGNVHLGFHIRTVRLDIIKVFYSPTNAQVIVLKKTILKFTLK